LFLKFGCGFLHFFFFSCWVIPISWLNPRVLRVNLGYFAHYHPGSISITLTWVDSNCFFLSFFNLILCFQRFFSPNYRNFLSIYYYYLLFYHKIKIKSIY
jgi:hypothetical protein